MERPPSVMIPMKPTKIISTDITPQVIKKVVEIYGRDGFLSKNSITNEAELSSDVILPNWIRNNAKWWAEDSITQKDFALGIEFMVNYHSLKLRSFLLQRPSF